MLRELNVNEEEILQEELSILKFICDNKDYVLNLLKGKQLDYSACLDGPFFEHICSKEQKIENYKNKISIYDLIGLNISVDISIENLEDEDMNIGYLKYLGNKFGTEYDPDESLRCYIDETTKEFIDHTYDDDYWGEYEHYLIEVVFASKKIDEFLSTYNSKTPEYMDFISIFGKIVFCIEHYDINIDVRTKTNKFFNHRNYQGDYKYQLCVIIEPKCSLGLEFYTDAYEFFEALMQFDIFLDKYVGGDVNE